MSNVFVDGSNYDTIYNSSDSLINEIGPSDYPSEGIFFGIDKRFLNNYFESSINLISSSDICFRYI